MNEPTPEQIAKLPKWAQEHITNLKRQRDNAKRELKEFLDQQTPSKVFTWADWDPPQKRNKRFLQDDRVSFILPGSHEIEVSLDDHFGLRIMGVPDQLAASPSSSNVLFVWCV